MTPNIFIRRATIVSEGIASVVLFAGAVAFLTVAIPVWVPLAVLWPAPLFAAHARVVKWLERQEAKQAERIAERRALDGAA